MGEEKRKEYLYVKKGPERSKKKQKLNMQEERVTNEQVR